MAEVDIGPETYESFSDVEFADVYLRADPFVSATWAELTGRTGLDEKGRMLVTATRILKRQDWLDGIPSFADTPAAVKEATAEFAGAILGGYDLGTPPASILPVKRQKAGSVEVEYFRDFDNPAYRPPPLPQAVWDLIKPLLVEPVSGGMLAGSYSSGTCGRSITEGPGVDDRMYFGGSGSRDWD